jgi:hypothetical protein
MHPSHGARLSLRFDHGSEVAWTQGALLLEIGGDDRQIVVHQRGHGKLSSVLHHGQPRHSAKLTCHVPINCPGSTLPPNHRGFAHVP